MSNDLRIALGDRLRRDTRHHRDSRLDLLGRDLPLTLAFRQQHLRRARLVDHVDRLVGQFAVVDVLGRKIDRRLDRFVRVFDLVIIFEHGLQTLEDLDRVFDSRLLHVDLLEATNESTVLFEVLAIFLVGCRADAAKRARLQRWLQQVRRIHRAARRRAGADDRVDFVDEQHRARKGFDFLHHGFEAFLEIAAIARACQQRTHVEREDRRALEHVGNLTANDLARQAFGDSRLADARVADEQRVVLLTAAEHLHRAHDFLLTADQRIDLAVARLLVEVHAVRVQRVAWLSLFTLGRGRILVDAANRARLEHARTLRDAMGDILNGVEPRHFLFLQEISGVAFPLGENADEHVGARHFLTARRLHVNDRALHDALERVRRMRVARRLRNDRLEFGIEVFDQPSTQLLEIDRAGTHDGRRIAVVDERQQQVLKRREFVMAHIRVLHRAVQRSFEIFGERCQSSPTLSP